MISIAFKIMKNLYPPVGPISRPIATPELPYPSSRKDLSVVTRYWKHLAFDSCVDIINHARLLHPPIKKEPDLK